jgi:alpha-1,3/alpha-1,6-mannosyltransferase
VILAVKAFARLRQLNPALSSSKTTPRLVLGGKLYHHILVYILLNILGGYDSRLKDNVQTIETLKETLNEFKLTYYIHHPESEEHKGNSSMNVADVIIILNFSMAERSALLNAPSTLALLYTPTNEHFGIGPVEAMVCGLPVLACNTGGPTETVIDMEQGEEIGTGWLRPPKQDAWAIVMNQIMMMNDSERKQLSERAAKRGRDHFALESLSRGIQKAVDETHSMGVVRWGYGLQLLLWTILVSLMYQVLHLFGVFANQKE